MDFLSYLRIESENYIGKDSIVLIYVWDSNKPIKTRKNKLSTLDLQPFYKSKKQIQDCCPVCLSKIESNEYIRKLKCNHLFHKKCIDKWLRNNIDNPSCPNCRLKVIILD